jgi:pre-rRNA-processing protein TSR3
MSVTHPKPPGFSVIAVFHPREKLSKCTLWPLVKRFGFETRTFPDMSGIAWEDTVLLAPGDEPLTAQDHGKTVVIVDGTWRLAKRIAARIPAPRRSLTGFVSAYPRTSKLFRDPPGGLASAEALFVVSLVLGAELPFLLDDYRWKEEFLRLNRRRMEELRGVQENP